MEKGGGCALLWGRAGWLDVSPFPGRSMILVSRDESKKTWTNARGKWYLESVLVQQRYSSKVVRRDVHWRDPGATPHVTGTDV